MHDEATRIEHAGAGGRVRLQRFGLGGSAQMEIVKSILIVLWSVIVPLTVVIAPISFIFSLVFMFQVVANSKPEVRLWSRELSWNPFNIILRSELLTEEGLKYRRRLVVSILCFIIPILIVVLVGQFLKSGA